MKNFCLQSGVNYIDNGYGHVYGVQGGKISAVEVYSNSAGTVNVTLKDPRFSKETTVATVTVGGDGYGVASNLGVLFGYGQTLNVTGTPVESGNEYSVRCFYE